MKRSVTCGVREISGTSIIAVLFFCKACSMTVRYTSVLPLPVIPSSKIGRDFFPIFFVISVTANCCSSFNTSFLSWRSLSKYSAVRLTSFSSISIKSWSIKYCTNSLEKSFLKSDNKLSCSCASK